MVPPSAFELLLILLLAVAVGVMWRARQRARSEHAQRIASDRALKDATHLADLLSGISRAKTSHEVIREALAELLHAVDATAGAVVVCDGDTASIAHAVGYDVALVAAPLHVGGSPATPISEAIRRSELIVVESRAARASAFPKGSHEDFLQVHEAAAVVPLITANRTIGVVALSFAEARTFASDEQSLLLTAGRHTAQALARARLFEHAEQARAEGEAFRVRADADLRERQRAEEALRESEGKYRALAARTTRLYELSAALSEAMTLDAVAKVIVRYGRAVVGASAGSVAMLADGGRQFETLHAEEYTRQRVEASPRFAAEHGLCSTTAAATRKPVFVASLYDWQREYPPSAALAADSGYESAAALPLLAEGAVLGVLSFHFTAPVNFNEDYSALLRSVAQHCAQALDRARLYEAAQRARADAESANRAKDDFLSTVSHELRTPLTAMLGWASMLRNRTLDQSRTARALDAIFSNATRQAQLIEDLLDVSRIVAGRASLDLQAFDLAESIRGAVEAIMPLAEGKDLELRFEDLPTVSVVADRRRIEQVFLNLMSNAVKFTPPGGRISIVGTIAGDAVEVRVTDTGAGIDPAFLPHVFERFRQGDSSTARRVGGLGLGLFIARHLVEAQGGTIRVDSEGAGRGTSFTVRLPMSGAHDARSRPVSAAPGPADAALASAGAILTGVRVLVVDDEPDVREVMASALETCGASVTSAASARDALESLAASDFDVLLADIGMPDKDGYELIREIRDLPSIRLARIPAAAVTAFASDEDRQRAIAAGFQTHLAKPVLATALVQTVADLVHVEPQQG
jgi:signal transduction histidine kinase/CheY-like chemotaxis protein